jgi:hypothetical protein
LANIAKGESSSKTGKQRFTGIDVAEPHPILYKYSETLHISDEFRKNNVSY